MAAYSKLDFEVNLNGMFKVLHGGYAILSEEPDDDQGDHLSFPSPGPYHPYPSNMIIQTDQPWKVKCHWHVKGSLCLIIYGKWECNVYLEEMGAGEYKGSPFTTTIPFVNELEHAYESVVNIPANAIPPGVYRVTLSLQLLNLSPKNAPLPVAAFSDIGLLKVYESV
ncbi:MAG: hypothetical protein IPJ74_15620 [Saprospiraceae bacterium]|nr:hypothetical protein [Saprospiraceae bacterium]